MPTAPTKPLIVISYAHADEPEHPAEGEVRWLSFVTGYLRPAIKHGAVDLWLDRLMPGGADATDRARHRARQGPAASRRQAVVGLFAQREILQIEWSRRERMRGLAGRSPRRERDGAKWR
jgi:hypothetical protein